MLVNNNPFEVEIPEAAKIADGHWLEPTKCGFESNELVAIQEHPDLELEARAAAELRKKRFNPSASEVYKEVEIGAWLDKTESEGFRDLMGVHRVVFSTSDEDIGTINQYAYSIRWKDEAKVVYSKPIKPKFALREEGSQMLKKWCWMDVIQKGVSPNNSPLFFIRKKNGRCRLILDARLTNKETLTERWPLPSMESILN